MTSGATATTSNDDAELLCPTCDYRLRGLLSDRCPECGTPFDRTGSMLLRSLGRIAGESERDERFCERCGWRSSICGVLAGDVARPVSLADARRFRHIVVLLAYVPLLVALAWGGLAGFASTSRILVS